MVAEILKKPFDKYFNAPIEAFLRSVRQYSVSRIYL
jgi:hypothetical protein